MFQWLMSEWGHIHLQPDMNLQVTVCPAALSKVDYFKVVEIIQFILSHGQKICLPVLYI